MSGTELDVCEEWIYERLTGNGAFSALVGGRIYSSRVAQGQLLPAVVYSLMTPADVMGANGTRIMAMPVYLITVNMVSRSWDSLDSIVAAMDALLHKPPAMITTNGVMMGAVRENMFSEITDENDQEFRRRGGLYRLWAQVS